MATKPTNPPPQEQSRQPGRETEMQPEPEYIRAGYIGSRRLERKTALITGGDSGIGRAVAVHFAAEGAASVGIVYLEEDKDAARTAELVEGYGARCVRLRGDVAQPDFAKLAVEEFARQGGEKIDVLVNNAAQQFPVDSVEDLAYEQLDRTFRTNVYAHFLFVQACLPRMRDGACIVNTTSVTAYRGHRTLIDYSSTKGAIVSLTRSLAGSLAERGIRVNGVAPGPIWTPLIPASFDAEHVASFGKNTPMKRPGQPSEVAPCFVFLASADASYMTGQILHPNGGGLMAS